MNVTIGIDVGGTFTDIVVAKADGETIIAKAATTPADQSEGVLAGLALAADALGLTSAALLAKTSRIVHGTTVATNALLEGKTAPVGLLTTEGHRDIIEMREGLKPERYNLRMAPPTPLVPRRLRLPVRERLRPDGSIAIPLDQASLDRAIAELAAANVRAVRPLRCAPACKTSMSRPRLTCCRGSRSSNDFPPRSPMPPWVR
jgi:N-methylhydantoinase A